MPVYRMAEQEFCELKVDLELRHPQIEKQSRALPEVAEQLEAIDRGREFHEAVAASAEPISAEKIKRLPENRRIGLAQTVCKEPPGPSAPRRRWDEYSVRSLGTTRLRSATFHYDPEKARRELRFLTAYWLGTRQPIPTQKPTKCSVCRVNALQLCPVPRARFRGHS